MNFTYSLPVNLIFGCKKLEVLGQTTKEYGTKALLVTGTNSTKRSGVLDKAIAQLEAQGVNVIVFDEITQNPLTTIAYKGADIAQKNNCDVIVGIGGGSIMDAAKAIAFISQNDGDVSDYIFGKKQGLSALPIVLVPTTCGTGSEGNQIAVLTNPDTLDKKALYTPLILPKASIIDPELMMTMPNSVLSSVGFDAFTHSLESYIGLRRNPITEALCLTAMQLIAESLPKLLEDKADIDSWEKLSIAATLGGMNIGVAGVCVGHGLEHPASGLKDIVHGKGLAAITPSIVDTIFSHAPEKFSTVSKLLGGQNEFDCADTIRDFLKKINLNVTLSDLGITKQDIPWMVENARKIAAANLANTPANLSDKDIAEIYLKSL